MVETNGYAGGIVDGAVVSEHSPTPDLTVDIAAGVIYDQLAQRIAWSVLQNVDMSLDENGAATAVVSGSNEKWLSIFAEFTRNLTDPKTDGNGDTVFFDSAESFNLNVVQGTEAPTGTATKPSLRSNQVLIGDVLITYGMTQIQDSDIDLDRIEVPFDLSGSPNSIKAKNIASLAQDLLDIVNSATSGIPTLAGNNTFTGTNTFSDDVTVEADLIMPISSRMYWDDIITGYTSPRLFMDMAYGTQLSGKKLLFMQCGNEASGTSNMRIYLAEEEVALVSGAYWTASSNWAYDAGVSSASLFRLQSDQFRFEKYSGTTGWIDSAWEPVIRYVDSNFVVGSQTDGDIITVNSYGITFETTSGKIKFNTARSVVKHINLAQGQCEDNQWNLTSSFYWISAADLVEVFFPLGIPFTGASGTIQIDLLAKPGAARATQTNRMRIEVAYAEPNWTTPAIPSFSTIGSNAYDDGTSNVQVITWSSSFLPQSNRMYRLEIRSGNTSGTDEDYIYAIRVTCYAEMLVNGLVDI